MRALQSVNCWSDKKDIEILTLKQANKLYEDIKEYSPKTKVIQSHAPRNEKQFDEVYRLRADAIEINSRWFKGSHKKPIKLLYDEHLDLNTQEYRRFVKRKVSAFNEFIQGIDRSVLGVPLLFKLARQEQEMPLLDQLAFAVDGFTFSDSETIGVYYSSPTNSPGLYWGKSSRCGEGLRAETMTLVHILSERFSDTYFSASGGIMNAQDAQEAVHAGASSVQLCSAIYYHGFSVITDIKEALKTRRS
ncbi:MAG: hypothetical protein ACMXYD_00160 [Candidatus Woesearchaeota archaeon]